MYINIHLIMIVNHSIYIFRTMLATPFAYCRLIARSQLKGAEIVHADRLQWILTCLHVSGDYLYTMVFSCFLATPN